MLLDVWCVMLLSLAVYSRCLLCVVRFVVGCLAIAACLFVCLLFVDWYFVFVIDSCLLCAGCCLMFVVRRLLFAVCCGGGGCLLFVVCCS